MRYWLSSSLPPAPARIAGAPPPNPTAVSLRVLFIGNSLTYVNDLPGTLAGIARSGGDTIRVEMVARPNYALIDHLTAA